MAKQPLVSIIIPNYNRPKKILRCLDTVLRQTYSNVEVFVIDDASDVVFTYKKDPRVRVIRNVINLGPGPSRNIGFQQAKGDFVAFLDSDDYWDSNFLKETVAVLIKNPSAAMVYANGCNVDEFGKILGVRRNQIKQLDTILPEILSINRHWGAGGCLWRKKDIQNVRWISCRSWEDYAFDIDVAIFNNSIIGLKQTLVYYDTSGKDKLSKKISDDHITQKVLALQHISGALYVSPWRNHKMINKTVSYLILMTYLASSNQDDQHVLSEIFKCWNGYFNRLLWQVMMKLPGSQRMYSLELVTRMYRKQIR